MATEGAQKPRHETVLTTIENARSSSSWEERLAVVDLIDGLLGDLPSERTVERLIEDLDRLARDSKWEVRRAVVPVLANAGRPAVKSVIERLTRDDNQWVRQAAERAKRKLARITTPAEKQDTKARFAFETIKDLDGTSAPRIYQAAIRVGEKYYEELAGDTAHELNTYRAAMEGLLQELLVRIEVVQPATPGVNEIFQKIRDRSRYLKALVSGLLEYSRDAELLFEVYPLAPIIIEALDLAREKAGIGLGPDVETTVTISPTISVEVCRERFLQALVNILSNAFESLAGKDQRGRVVIEVQANAQNVSVAIADTGSGMDAAQVENATKRFRSLKKAKGGIGLGLPLAVKIVEREHSGRVDIESTLGVGTTVTVELPLRREAP
jgi:signal transduction histidine kinase